MLICVPNIESVKVQLDLPLSPIDSNLTTDSNHDLTTPIVCNFRNVSSTLNTRNNNDNIALILAVINCHAKKPLFDNFVSVYKPDIIAGTESWLRLDIQNSEIFCDDYQVFRHDRSDGFGGVFLACNKIYSWNEIDTSNYLCELIASELNYLEVSL